MDIKPSTAATLRELGSPPPDIDSLFGRHVCLAGAFSFSRNAPPFIWTKSSWILAYYLICRNLSMGNFSRLSGKGT